MVNVFEGRGTDWGKVTKTNMNNGRQKKICMDIRMEIIAGKIIDKNRGSNTVF